MYLSQTSKHDVKLVHPSRTVESQLTDRRLKQSVHGVRIFRVVAGR